VNKNIALIVTVVVLIAIAIGAGIVQAKPNQPHLAPGVWYSTNMHTDHDIVKWDYSDKDDKTMDYVLLYQRIDDTLFLASNRYVGVFRLKEGEDNVWVKSIGHTNEIVAPSGTVFKHAFIQPPTVTIAEDGITITSTRDVYMLVNNQVGAPPWAEYFVWRGHEHRTSVSTGLLGKPTRP